MKMQLDESANFLHDRKLDFLNMCYLGKLAFFTLQIFSMSHFRASEASETIVFSDF